MSVDPSASHYPFRRSLLVATEVTLRTGERRVIRALQSGDAVPFGDFLEGLSVETRRRYRPHELDRQEAGAITARAPEEGVLRIVALVPDERKIVAYVVAELAIPDDEAERFRSYGVPLDGAAARVAPVVGDAHQGLGLGTAILRHALELLRARAVVHVVLFGGTQATNTGAAALYHKVGFRKVGEFRHDGVNNHDMHLLL